MARVSTLSSTELTIINELDSIANSAPNEALAKEGGVLVNKVVVVDLPWKKNVACATVGNITLSGEQTIDGVLTSASRVLVKNQTTESENGVYVSDAGAWTRATDMDASAEFNSAVITVDLGTINGSTNWRCEQINPTLGVDSITFATFGASSPYASTTNAGVVELATLAETEAKSLDTLAVTPASLLNFATLDSIVGTTNEIDVTLSLGQLILSLPNNVHLGVLGKLGRDADNLIDFSTDNKITFRTNGSNGLSINSNGILSVDNILDYETLVVADDDIPNKKYIDDLGYVQSSTPVVDNSVVRYDATTGKLIQDSGVLINDLGELIITDIISGINDSTTNLSLGVGQAIFNVGGEEYLKSDSGANTLTLSSSLFDTSIVGDSISLTSQTSIGNVVGTFETVVDASGFKINDGVYVVKVIDDDTMATATDSTLSTSESIVDYIASLPYGDVFGPSSSTIGAVATYSDLTGKLIGDSGFSLIDNRIHLTSDISTYIDFGSTFETLALSVGGSEFLQATPTDVLFQTGEFRVFSGGDSLTFAETLGLRLNATAYVTGIYSTVQGATTNDGHLMTAGLINSIYAPIDSPVFTTEVQIPETNAAINTDKFVVLDGGILKYRTQAQIYADFGFALAGANSDITSLSGLTTALSVPQGGTGSVTLTANSILLGNGTSELQEVSLAEGDILLGTPSTPVASNMFTGTVLNLANGGTGLNLSAITKGSLIVGTGIGTTGLRTVGADGLYLKANSSVPSGMEWDTPVGAGNVVSALNITDNVLIKGDGGVKGIQETGIVIDDSNNIIMSNGTALQTGTTIADTLLLQAYDTDGATYTTVATLTAGDTPTFDLMAGTTVGGSPIGTMNNVVDDVTPELGGNLDTNGKYITFDTNRGIQDENGNSQLIFNTTASAVEYIEIKNASLGTAPIISAKGVSTNLPLTLLPKGTGVLNVAGTVDYENNVLADDDIPNKKYVDDEILASDTITASNGLTRTVDDIELGGVLTSDVNLDGTFNFASLSFTGLPEFRTIVTNLGTWYHKLHIREADVEMYFANNSNGATHKGFKFDATNMTITDSISSKGLIYAGDYSTNYVDRSLIDKGFADLTYSPIAGSSNIVTVGTIGTGTWQGTAIADTYISSAVTWNAKQDALTFGISDTNSVVIDSSTVADDEYARFTASGLESRSVSEVKTDLSLNNVENTAISTWTGSSNITTVGTLSSGDADAIVSSASDTTAGKVELATSTETTTGTDTTRAVTPDGLAGSDYGKRIVGVLVESGGTDLATGDALNGNFFRVPAVMNGYNLVAVSATVDTAGTTGTTDIQVRNVTQTADMLSTKITIDSAGTDSSTATTPAVIDTANDDVATGDKIVIDVDAVSTTAPKGLYVELIFQLP